MKNQIENVSKNGGLLRVNPTDGASSQPESRYFGDGVAYEPQYPFTELIMIYETNNTARKCIELYAKNVVGAGFTINADDEKTANDAEQLAIEEFFSNCNPEHNFDYIIREMIIDLKTTGNGAIEVARSKLTKKPNKIFNIPIDTLRFGKGGKDKGYKTGQRFVQNLLYGKQEASDFIWYNRYLSNEEDRTLENGYNPELNGADKVTNEVMFFKEPNPRDLHYGISPSVTLLRNYLLTKYAEEFNINQFENGLLSKFIVTVKNGIIGKESLEGLKEFLAEIRQKKAWSSIPILNLQGEKAAVEIVKLLADIPDGAYLNLLKFNREEVYVAFGVPPILLGIVENANRSNSIEQAKKFYEDEIIPLQQEIALRFTRMIKDDFGFTNWTFKFNQPDFRNMVEEEQIATEGVSDGSLSINEKRAILGYDPIMDAEGNKIEGADMHIVHTNQGLIPVSQLENLTSEAYASNVGSAQAKSIIDSIMHLRDEVVKKVQKKKIISGTETKEDNELGDYPQV